MSSTNSRQFRRYPSEVGIAPPRTQWVEAIFTNAPALDSLNLLDATGINRPHQFYRALEQ